MITAEVHTDDWAARATFDATPYFEQADDDTLIALSHVGYGGDYEADDVALFFSDLPEVDTVFAHGAIMDIGFECHVDEQQADAWIIANRPALAEAMEISLP